MKVNSKYACVNREYQKLKKLADEGEVDPRLVKDAISSFELDVDRPVAWLPQAHPSVQEVAAYTEVTEEK